jgi:hypothetical protein
MMEEIRSSEMSILLRATWRPIPEEGIFIDTAVKTSNLTMHSPCVWYTGGGRERRDVMSYPSHTEIISDVHVATPLHHNDVDTMERWGGRGDMTALLSNLLNDLKLWRLVMLFYQK